MRIVTALGVPKAVSPLGVNARKLTMLNIGINSAKVVRLRHGADKIYLNTNLPEGTWPFVAEETADVVLTVARGDSEEYLKRHFAGIPVEVIVL